MKDTTANDQNLTGDGESLAILIDGHNAQPSLIKEMLAESSKYGRITVRRIYGDWTTPNMNGRKDALHANAIKPGQQFRIKQLDHFKWSERKVLIPASMASTSVRLN